MRGSKHDLPAALETDEATIRQTDWGGMTVELGDIRASKEVHMSSSRLIRWSGLALLVGGLVLGIATILHPDDADPNAVLAAVWGPVHLALTVGALLSLFGLIGFFIRQRDQAGAVGLIGFLLLFAGTALFIPILIIETLIVPTLAADAAGQALLDPLFGGPLGLFFMVTGVIFALGCLVSAIATVRAGALPRLAGVLLVGGALLAFNPPLPHIAGAIGGVMLGLGYAWIGYAIWSRAPEPAMQAKTAT